MSIMQTRSINVIEVKHFNCVDELLDIKQHAVLPTHSSTAKLATQFNTYFKEKITDIRKLFPLISESSSCCLSFNGIVLDSFEPATEDEIRSTILTHGIKCSPEDTIPA